MSTASYDPELVTLQLGSVTVDGYAEGTSIDASPASDRYSSRAGALGDVVRTKKHDRRHTLTVTLMPSAVCNAALAELEQSGEVFSLLLKDNISGEVLEAAHGWVQRQPNTTKGDEAANKVWVIATGASKANHLPLPAHT